MRGAPPQRSEQERRRRPPEPPTQQPGDTADRKGADDEGVDDEPNANGGADLLNGERIAGQHRQHRDSEDDAAVVTTNAFRTFSSRAGPCDFLPD
ncbi:hypothetical protein A4G28_24075 [Mycobacterium ostraviense]|uniref:Uncharacterized protein n=1 Tax=Mycobacterium ostraviense TaxID=2738409 RepID=A0A163Z0Y3_9MYCO|nr:hypothetical protein A4G28_24075 [Mycobacterium ostraviense]